MPLRRAIFVLAACIGAMLLVVQINGTYSILAAIGEVPFSILKQWEEQGATTQVIRSFQSTHELLVTGMMDTKTRTSMNGALFAQLCPLATTTEPNLSDFVVTKTVGLPIDYIPADLVSLQGVVPVEQVSCVTKQTSGALSLLFAAARADGVMLAVTSGFRRPEIQSIGLNGKM